MPVAARPAGYAALIAAFGLQVPAPDALVAIGEKHTMRQDGRWRILTPRYRPDDTISAHLDFALRHEAVDLGILNALFTAIPKGAIEEWVKAEPTGQHARRAWFLYEWLTGQRLALPDAPKAPYIGALDEQRQFAVRGETVTRYRIRNNLPGTPDFCPLVRRTDHLTAVTGAVLAEEARKVVHRTAPDLMARAAAFLLLQDSKASYVIEGEHPPQDRIQRWGQAIGEAGQRPLTADELLRLQRIVIGKARFMHFGWRAEGGFVGTRDRDTNAPIPDHVSARPEDIAGLIDGLIAYAERAEKGGLDPVTAAAAVAFGFVFIHPFEDGNGRIHRWLVHHMLSRSGFNPPGMIFPVSAVFLQQIGRYREVLEHYSHPRLLLTQWETTPTLNVRVLNRTGDLFRFFDATSQAEFLADSVAHTIRKTLPDEVEYLRRYDQARQRIGAFIEMPDATFDLMMGFLRQNGGAFSQRARSKEFAELTEEEVAAIESIYRELLSDHDGASSGGLDDHDARS
ncbi:Fic family protein [Taklimakanibacter lacteus]|uniref:Fic family protein n=1 Tax=Taklimakanibacter lacteus TaxID=2268456 RepID=UPI000E661315